MATSEDINLAIDISSGSRSRFRGKDDTSSDRTVQRIPERLGGALARARGYAVHLDREWAEGGAMARRCTAAVCMTRPEQSCRSECPDAGYVS